MKVGEAKVGVEPFGGLALRVSWGGGGGGVRHDEFGR